MIILVYYYKNYNYGDDYIPAGEVSYFTLSSIILSFLSVVLLSKDANKRNRIFRQSGQKPKSNYFFYFIFFFFLYFNFYIYIYLKKYLIIIIIIMN